MSQRSQNASQFMSQSKHQGPIETNGSDQQSLYNSYRKINTFLNGDRNEFDISKALVATDKKDKRDSKQILQTLNESKHLSNVKSKFENKGEEINPRKTVVFKQSYKNLDEINEKGFASFSVK